MRFPSRQDRRSRSQRWNDAVQVLLDLQEEYREWLDELPEGLRLAREHRSSRRFASGT